MHAAAAVLSLRNRLFRRLLRRNAEYEPTAYWDARAPELIEGYDNEETWVGRGWVRPGIEEALIPPLLRAHACRSVVVAGAGSGRQYRYLSALAIELRGFDISPTLVDAALSRFPAIATTVDDLLTAPQTVEPADAAISVSVLQHVSPRVIATAVSALKALGRNLVVVRELTTLEIESDYQWAHDYDRLFAPWSAIFSEETDRGDNYRVELRAYAP